MITTHTKKHLSLLFLILFVSFSACKNQRSAADPDQKEEKVGKSEKKEMAQDLSEVLERINKRVELTDDQIQKATELHASYDFGNVDEVNINARIKEFSQEIIRTILTDEQRSTLKKDRKKD